MILVLTHSCVDITVAIFNDFIPIRNSVTANFEACICFFRCHSCPTKSGGLIAGRTDIALPDMIAAMQLIKYILMPPINLRNL